LALNFFKATFLVFFVVMKGLYIGLIFFFTLATGLQAQEIDTIPINTNDLNLRLKRSPLPSRMGNLEYKPVQLMPVVIDAKVNYWNTRTSVGINLNQAAFSNNWTGGGVNSLALTGLINHRAEYSREGYSYVSELILNYGKVRNKNQLEKKTVDRIFWDNKAAIQLSKNWYFFGSLNFESQFDLGYSFRSENGQEIPTLLSRFMSPGYLTESIGFEYKPSKYFSTRIGTGTARQTFVLDTSLVRINSLAENSGFNNYGVPAGATFKNELAFQVVSNFDKEIAKNLNLKMRYLVFIPYDRLDYTNHRLDVELRARVNKFMNVTVTGVGLYDKNTTDKIQASQTLALGMVFMFPR
jgi:hypothetical protein